MKLKNITSNPKLLKDFLVKNGLKERELLFMIFLELVRQNSSQGALTQPNHITTYLKDRYNFNLEDSDELNLMKELRKVTIVDEYHPNDTELWDEYFTNAPEELIKELQNKRPDLRELSNNGKNPLKYKDVPWYRTDDFTKDIKEAGYLIFKYIGYHNQSIILDG